MNLKHEVVTGEPLNAIEKVSDATNYAAGTYRITYKMFFDPSDAGGGDWDVYTVQESLTVPLGLRSELEAYLTALYGARVANVDFLMTDETVIDEAILTFAELT